MIVAWVLSIHNATVSSRGHNASRLAYTIYLARANAKGKIWQACLRWLSARLGLAAAREEATSYFVFIESPGNRAQQRSASRVFPVLKPREWIFQFLRSYIYSCIAQEEEEDSTPRARGPLTLWAFPPCNLGPWSPCTSQMARSIIFAYAGICRCIKSFYI